MGLIRKEDVYEMLSGLKNRADSPDGGRSLISEAIDELAYLPVVQDRKKFFEVYDKRTGKIADTEWHPYFKDYELMVTDKGKIAMAQFGDLICFADDKLYGAMPVEGGGLDGDA